MVTIEGKERVSKWVNQKSFKSIKLIPKEKPVEEELFTFKVGDVVEFGGLRGVVTAVETMEPYYPVEVRFGGLTNQLIEYEHFTADGRYLAKHTIPLLILVEHPKKKVKRSREVWVNIYKTCTYTHESKEYADRAPAVAGDRLALVGPVLLEWESEE